MSTMVSPQAAVTVTVGRDEISFETGKLAKQADGAVLVRSGRHDGPRHGAGPAGAARGRRLLPAHGRRRGADVRRREDPGRLLQARGTPDREGDPDRAHDRPPDPAALAEGLPKRGAGHLHDPLGRPRHGARHPLHQRRLRGAHALAAAVLRARSAPCASAGSTAELVVNPTLPEAEEEPSST